MTVNEVVSNLKDCKDRIDEVLNIIMLFGEDQKINRLASILLIKALTDFFDSLPSMEQIVYEFLKEKKHEL